MKLSYIEIDNFKAFIGFKMDFSDITAVIGDNAAGKSSLIQALAFLRYTCTQGAALFFNERSMKIENIVSKIPPAPKKIIQFKLGFESSEEKLIDWSVSFTARKQSEQIELREEHVTVRGHAEVRPEKVLSYSESAESYRMEYRGGKPEKVVIPSGRYMDSLIINIDRKLADVCPELWAIHDYFENMVLLDLLTPKDMRRAARSSERSLGTSGEKLPALIKRLTPEEMKDLCITLGHVLPGLSSVQSVMKGGPGWAHLKLLEKYGDRRLSVESPEISDGSLRLIAYYALKYLEKKGGMTLLDEVEDGINSANLRDFLEYIKKYAEDSDQQVLITTHSTVLIDEFAPENIRYMYRDEHGAVQCKVFGQSEEIQRQLEFL